MSCSAFIFGVLSIGPGNITHSRTGSSPVVHARQTSCSPNAPPLSDWVRVVTARVLKNLKTAKKNRSLDSVGAHCVSSMRTPARIGFALERHSEAVLSPFFWAMELDSKRTYAYIVLLINRGATSTQHRVGGESAKVHPQTMGNTPFDSAEGDVNREDAIDLQMSLVVMYRGSSRWFAEGVSPAGLRKDYFSKTAFRVAVKPAVSSL